MNSAVSNAKQQASARRQTYDTADHLRGRYPPRRTVRVVWDQHETFEVWLAALPLRAHTGLVDFWRRTGGGEVFERETLLGPLAVDESDNVLKMTEHHRSRGLPAGLLLFHIGVCLSASSLDKEKNRNRVVTLNPNSYQVAASSTRSIAGIRRFCGRSLHLATGCKDR